ncbi:hypothetical protein ACFOJE_20870 [Azotobacter bryophylli]|jgi:hypothetical protein|uniref:Uncharacterized protein n=1 Tax=Azotobacter bryophylli TaxID=1986537 RepID=A0ABV7AYI9_9GAMM
MTERTDIQQLADQVENCITAIIGLAKAVHEDLAFEGSDAGPRMSTTEVDAIHFSIITIAQVAGNDLATLLNKLGVPV